MRLVCVLLLAVLASAPVGLALNALASELHCEGERLACNIDVAIGAYATIMVAVLGPLIYGVTLVVATNRTALLGATLVLLTPLMAAYALAEFDSWRYVGFHPYPALRTFLVMLLPPIATILTQWLALRTAIRRGILS
ncbi:MAG TPA: hypothetical protein VIG52_03880 [Methyloceanibacter sp.]